MRFLSVFLLLAHAKPIQGDGLRNFGRNLDVIGELEEPIILIAGLTVEIDEPIDETLEEERLAQIEEKEKQAQIEEKEKQAQIEEKEKQAQIEEKERLEKKEQPKQLILIADLTVEIDESINEMLEEETVEATPGLFVPNPNSGGEIQVQVPIDIVVGAIAAPPLGEALAGEGPGVGAIDTEVQVDEDAGLLAGIGARVTGFLSSIGGGVGNRLGNLFEGLLP